ncbi:MAG: Na/Pi cotransporter family protein, partial [Gammaproteobacteria bacterium]
SKETIPVDIERIYATKIKSVYSKILEYATILQSKFALEKNKIETIRNILIADRMLVLVVKRMVPLHKNIVRALSSNNHALLQEYNQIRRKILKVIRQIHRASLSDQPVKYIEKIEKQKAKAEELDVLLSGHVNKLVLDGAITNDMATSLMNDSEEAQHIVRDLVDIATLLYYPRDELIDQIEEQELELRATS